MICEEIRVVMQLGIVVASRRYAEKTETDGEESGKRCCVTLGSLTLHWSHFFPV